ncbi:uncharacterized protein LOC111932445 [Cyanistes caeruleus]|uniref:uncharacterized protein LOC111932445 n=1 Tax=Cyanistes caeruleus TaxID=156563 RepID=UPI000CDA3152|nr:uncharacterized protein LOC111932445 [Cyanistes caeruleus]XP_023787305.1 uncharacterized protein LOC111932445 [Cyanistes caeruleus]XP_023787306.1 uncharacterized protein LOC111932445 [Cyanistes caeruleus]
MIKENEGFLIDMDERQNMWVTWANQTGQDNFCLSMATPSDPFRTCLVGAPLDDSLSATMFKNWTKNWKTPKEANKTLCEIPSGKFRINICDKGLIQANPIGAQNWYIATGLNVTGSEPQELRLLGSTLSNYCLNFVNRARNNHVKKSHGPNGTNVSPQNLLYLQNNDTYCGNWSRKVNSSNTPLQLPPGVFLICGDRAWQGLPANTYGGPCYFGKLTLFAPTIQQLLRANRTRLRKRRSVFQLGPECKDQVELWEQPTVIVSSIFTPGVSSAQAFTQLRRLACWTGKQFNITSKVLSDLLLDMNSVRHAVLQNRAAIDFLLLAQGHGCEDFDRMCCMNLSDHSVSIHTRLQQLQRNMKKLTMETNPLEEWFQSLGLTGWLKNLAQMAIVVILIIVIVLLFIPCILQCLQNMIKRATSTVLLVQKENRGIVEEWLESKGHIPMQQLAGKELDNGVQLV